MMASGRRPLRYNVIVSLALMGSIICGILSELIVDPVTRMVFYLLSMILLSTFLCLVVRWFLLDLNKPTLNSLIMFAVPLLLSASFFYLPYLVSIDLNNSPTAVLIAYIIGYLIIIYGSFIVLLQYHLHRKRNAWNRHLTAVFALSCAILSSVVFLTGSFIENADLVFALKLIASTNSLSTAMTVLYVIREKNGKS